MNVNEELKRYVEQNIFPQYNLNDKGHQIEHIKYVINRCSKLSKNMDVDNNMLYIIAAYHDIGYHIDYKNHEIVSAQIMYNDINLNKFFSNENLIIMKEAIEDHRASLDREPRSIYGKLLSSADRNIDVDDSLKRIYLYSITHFNKLSEKETIEECYKHTLKKFGNNGYANFFVEDTDYNNYLKELQQLLNNKEKFIERLKDIITKIK
ncbi:MAG: HD domain-containing protein [Bacilli bacterium]|nr:HD domain-containing protein [Bacilli bacterium]